MQWADHVTEVRWADHRDRIGKSPAAVYRATGVIVLNPVFRYKLKPAEWYFILLHEAGHIALKSSNEKAVDAWAFNQYVKRGHSLKAAVKALITSFSFDTFEQLERANLQYQRALNFQQTTSRPQPRIHL
jgi:hypothetical protein